MAPPVEAVGEGRVLGLGGNWASATGPAKPRLALCN